MSFSDGLTQIATSEYASGTVHRRWGQLLRETAELRSLIENAEKAGRLVPLGELVSIRGGVVTRANNYFLVDEIPFEQIPSRFRITKSDLERIAVVMDGLEKPNRIERAYLRPAIKGPEALLGPKDADAEVLRVVDITRSKDELEDLGHTGALAYLKRGETESFNSSSDDLKGGIPAKRSNTKNRKPYWYSLSVPSVTGVRIIIPEHLDTRYPATLLDASDETVVIDKLYILEPKEGVDPNLLLAALHSVLTWYQVEVRGRTQLGEGVLELKKPDWAGVQVLHPNVDEDRQQEIIQAFDSVPVSDVDNFHGLGHGPRLAFDTTYLSVVLDNTDEATVLETLLDVEGQARALAAERNERRESVSQDRAGRSRATSVGASVDAYATKVVADLPPFPDPRDFVGEGVEGRELLVDGPVEGPLRVGQDLFDQGHVYSGEKVVVKAGDGLAAKYASAILLLEPDLATIDVPIEGPLREILKRWHESVQEWRSRFQESFEETTRYLRDDRVKKKIEERARKLAHSA